MRQPQKPLSSIERRRFLEYVWGTVGASLDVSRHPAYDALVDKVMGAVTDPKQMETYSRPEQIAEVVYEAATDGKDQLRYLAGPDAIATHATRRKLGDEAFRTAIEQEFFG